MKLNEMFFLLENKLFFSSRTKNQKIDNYSSGQKIDLSIIQHSHSRYKVLAKCWWWWFLEHYLERKSNVREKNGILMM